MLPKTALISMSRSGHRAVLRWLWKRYKIVGNIESKPFEMSMRRAGNDNVTLLIRDYPNWAASLASYFHDHHSFDPMIDAWITHAEAAHSVPTILFNEWVEAGHGDDIEIFGSDSFGTGHVLTRAKQMAGHPVYERLMQREDALAANERVFGACEVAA